MASELFEPTLDLILDAGQTLLENGGEVFRAQQTMEIMAHSLGVEEFHVYVLTNGIFASARPAGGTSISMVRHVPRVSIHLGRVEAVNELSRELAAGQLDLIQARRKLADARAIGDTPPRAERLACVVGSAGFAFLFGGMLPEILVAAVAGLLESFVCQWFGKRRINRIFTDIVAACLSTLWALGVVIVVQQLEGGMLSPQLMSDATRLHPVAVVLCVMLGGTAGGIGGILLSVPLLLCARAALRVIGLRQAGDKARP